MWTDQLSIWNLKCLWFKTDQKTYFPNTVFLWQIIASRIWGLFSSKMCKSYVSAHFGSNVLGSTWNFGKLKLTISTTNLALALFAVQLQFCVDVGCLLTWIHNIRIQTRLNQNNVDNREPNGRGLGISLDGLADYTTLSSGKELKIWSCKFGLALN